eukprot:scaffold1220_cov259-Pinguiococcus_pyrenoidosus.AAC.95
MRHPIPEWLAKVVSTFSPGTRSIARVGFHRHPMPTRIWQAVFGERANRDLDPGGICVARTASAWLGIEKRVLELSSSTPGHTFARVAYQSAPQHGWPRRGSFSNARAGRLDREAWSAPMSPQLLRRATQLA